MAIESHAHQMLNGEPTFLIRAGDPLGAALVEEWCRRYRNRIANKTGEFTPEQARVHAKNLQHAMVMSDWFAVHGDKT